MDGQQGRDLEPGTHEHVWRKVAASAADVRRGVFVDFICDGCGSKLDLDNLVPEERWVDPTCVLVYDQQVNEATPDQLKGAFYDEGRKPRLEVSQRLGQATHEFLTVCSQWGGHELKGDAFSSLPTQLWVLLAPLEDSWREETLRFFEQADLTTVLWYYDIEGIAAERNATNR